MIADEQTQRLPSDDLDLERFARLCGHRPSGNSETWITRRFRAVERHYARLFEHAPSLDAAAGSLVFTGVVDDPETLETLKRLGFKDVPLAAETVRGWHFGRRAAVQTARAREVLTELVPDLLQSLAGSGDPDAALAAFDDTLAHMPAAIKLFSILRSNKQLRDLFGDVLGAAPRLAAIVAKTPHVLDAVIDPLFYDAVLDRVFFEGHIQRLYGWTLTRIFSTPPASWRRRTCLRSAFVSFPRRSIRSTQALHSRRSPIACSARRWPTFRNPSRPNTASWRARASRRSRRASSVRPIPPPPTSIW